MTTAACFSTVMLFYMLSLSSVYFASAVDFLFDSFKAGDLILVGDARVDSSVVRLTNDSNQFSIGRAFFPTKLTMSDTANGTVISSFSTSFLFSVLPEIEDSPGFGFAFVLSNATSPAGANSGQYFGLFSNSVHRRPGPLLAVEFDTGRNPEFADPDGNHVGVDLNYIESSFTRPAGYYRTTTGATSSYSSSNKEEFVALDMRSGRNIRAWIEFDGARLQINVTLAPAEETRKPRRPLISYADPEIASYISKEMFVGFSASKVTWVEAQRILAWSLSDTGRPARELNTSDLPVFSALPSSSSPSTGLIVGVSCAAVAVALLGFAGFYYYCCCYRKKRKKRIGGGNGDDEEEEEEEMEEWEVSYWPHRFSYEELWNATNGFSREQLLGYGGFGKVYKGVLSKNKTISTTHDSVGGGKKGDQGEEKEEVAVKCVSHDSKQGLREFMAEISSMGRLRHKNLIHMKGWCRKGHQLMLVYEYMPNGNLNRWIFPPSSTDEGDESHGGGGGSIGRSVPSSSAAAAGYLLGWEGRRRVLGDVAEGLEYLHHGWDQMVVHRDVKPSNILLDAGMRGRLGDFGLAKLYQHGQSPCNTRVVGTLGYLAPELAHVPAPTAASDVYSFGVVVLEVVCGRRPIETAQHVDDDDLLLVEWVRELYAGGRLLEAADRRNQGEYRAEEMELVLKLGLACCHPDPEQRPSMREVVEVLDGEEVRQKQNPPPPDSAMDVTGGEQQQQDESPLMTRSD